MPAQTVKGFLFYMNILNKARKVLVLKEFKLHTKDKGGACILGAELQVFNPVKEVYEYFITQDEVCTAQGETAIIAALKEVKAITNRIFPSLQTMIYYGELD